MFESCLQKQNEIRALFSACKSEEEKYEKIIELGKEAKRLSHENKSEENLVPGCQSIMHLYSYLREGLVYFEAESDALISSGLAALLTKVYSGEPPETVLKCPPDYLQELQISTSLTPHRANGLYSIHLKMKQDALKLMMGPKS